MTSTQFRDILTDSYVIGQKVDLEITLHAREEELSIPGVVDISLISGASLLKLVDADGMIGYIDIVGIETFAIEKTK